MTTSLEKFHEALTSLTEEYGLSFDVEKSVLSRGERELHILLTPLADMYALFDGTHVIGGVGQDSAERHIRDWCERVTA